MTRASLFLPGLALTTIFLGTSAQLTWAETEEISQSFTQEAGFEKHFQSPRTTHTPACAHPATPEDHSRIGIVFSTIQDIEGWLPSSPAPDKIIPSSPPQTTIFRQSYPITTECLFILRGRLCREKRNGKRP